MLKGQIKSMRVEIKFEGRKQMISGVNNKEKD